MTILTSWPMIALRFALALVFLQTGLRLDSTWHVFIAGVLIVNTGMACFIRWRQYRDEAGIRKT